MYKTNLYGVSEVKQNDNGDTIIIPSPLVSDNNKFELTLQSSNNKGIFKITNKQNNEVYWNSADYNRDVYNNPGTYGLSANLGTETELALQNNGDIVIRSKANPLLQCFSLSQQSKYGTHLNWFNANKLGPFSIKLSDTGILELRNKSNAVIWKSTYMWESIDTPFSVELIREDQNPEGYPYAFKKNTYNIEISDTLIYDYYTKFLKNKNKPPYFNPFKIVPLKLLTDLQLSSKTSNRYYTFSLFNGSISGIGGDFSYLMNFSSLSTYLPLGDICYQGQITDQLLNNIMVILVKNEDKYCKKKNISQVQTSWICNQPKTTKCSSSSSFTNSNWILDNIQSIYKFQSEAGYNNDCEIIQTNSSAYYGLVNNNFIKPFHERSLKIYTPQTSTIAIFFDNVFGNYKVSEPEKIIIAEKPAEIANATHKLTRSSIDYIPETVFVNACTNNYEYKELYITLNDGELINNVNTPFTYTIPGFNMTNFSCNELVANGYCGSGSVYIPSDECISYYKTTKSDPTSTNYDTILEDFCNTNDNYKKDIYKSFCACHSPPSVYQNYINAILDGLPDAQRKVVEPAISLPPPCNYPLCSIEGPGTPPRWNFKKGEECPDSAIQICLNDIDIINQGNITGNVNVSTVIDCLQQNIDTTNPTTPPPVTTTPPPVTTTPPPGGNGTTKKSSNTLWIILGVVFVVLIILYFTVFKK